MQQTRIQFIFWMPGQCLDQTWPPDLWRAAAWSFHSDTENINQKTTLLILLKIFHLELHQKIHPLSNWEIPAGSRMGKMGLWEWERQARILWVWNCWQLCLSTGCTCFCWMCSDLLEELAWSIYWILGGLIKINPVQDTCTAQRLWSAGRVLDVSDTKTTTN